MGTNFTSRGMRACLATAIALFIAPVAQSLALPEIISLGSGTPNSVTNDLAGVRYIGGSGFGGVGAARWTLSGGALTGANIGSNGGGAISADGLYQSLIIPNNSPQIFGNAATGVTPPFSMTPTLVPTAINTSEFRAARWSSSGPTILDCGGLPVVPTLMVYGSSSSGGSSGTFVSPNSMSKNGRFIAGQAYVSTYNSAAGTTISANSFHWRPYIWDSQANGGLGAITVLPTPFRTTSNTWRRRTGAAWAVSDDGLVIVGAQEHNVAGGAGPDPDGGRLVVWRWDSGSSSYVMSYLPNGTDANGNFFTYSTSVGTIHMNSAGTIIVGRAVADLTGSGYIAKWTWDAGSQTWNAPVVIGSNLTTQASWLPAAVTSCGVPPTLSPSGMSEDGNTVVGVATYSTCGSFMAGGFIWTSQDNVIADWYDYLVALGMTEVTANFGPIGDFGDPTRGLPRLGFPSGISSDGSAVVGFQGGNQLIPGAPAWVLLTDGAGGGGCTEPMIANNPTASVLVSACTSSVILNAAASGSLPLTYQWYKDDVALTDGVTPSGADMTGATSFQLRINRPGTLDFGTYRCDVTGECGATVSTTNSIVQIDPAFPIAANDICAGAINVAQGTNVLAPAQSPCAAYDNDPVLSASCASGSKTDRWFRFTPSVTQEYRLETCGSNYDTTLSIYSDCNGFELACNNDYITGPATGCTSSRSRIGRIALDAGTPYLIRIAAPAAAFLSGTSTMNLSINPAPAAVANDDCSTAAVAILGTNAFDLTEATPSGELSFCDSVSGTGRDVWFMYTPTLKGKMRAATCPGTTLNTVLGVYEGQCGFEVACNDNAGVTGCFNQSIVDNFAMNAGQVYSFRVAGNNLSAVGAGTLTLSYVCDADIVVNGVIDLTDLSTLLSNFGTESGATHAMGDIDGDGDVDLTDLSQLLTAFGLPCS